MTPPPSRIAAAALLALALSACSARDPARTAAITAPAASLDALASPQSPAARRGAAQSPTPVVVLPDWIGRPRALQEQDGADAFEQTLALGAAPRGSRHEDRVVLRLPRADNGAGGLDAPPSEAGIRAELAALFPDLPMQVVKRPAANVYGPYGLAVGRAGDGTRCLYAWQWIAQAPAIEPGGRGPAALRISLCRRDITLEAMAAAVNQLRLVPRFSGRPLAAQTVQAAQARPHRRAAHRIVQSPAKEAPAAEPQAAPGGRRYLGVAEAAPALRPVAPYGLASSPETLHGHAAGPAPASLSADLPPEALRGPTGRTPGRP